MPKTINDLPSGTLALTSELEMQNGANGQKTTGQGIVDLVNSNSAPWQVIASAPVNGLLGINFDSIPTKYNLLMLNFDGVIAGSSTNMSMLGRSGGTTGSNSIGIAITSNIAYGSVLIPWSTAGRSILSALILLYPLNGQPVASTLVGTISPPLTGLRVQTGSAWISGTISLMGI